MEGVCIFLNKKYEWKTAQQLLGDVNNFLNNLILGYDKENISEKVLRNFKVFYENK